MNIKIEPYAQDRANEIADLYHASVHAIDEDTYTKAEQEAWAPTPPNYEAWVNRLNIKKLELWVPCTHTSSISPNKNRSKGYG